MSGAGGFDGNGAASGGEGAEPEVGSSEWLLQQLSGGRLTTRRQIREAEAAAAAAGIPLDSFPQQTGAIEPLPAPRADETAEQQPSRSPLVEQPPIEPAIEAPAIAQPLFEESPSDEERPRARFSWETGTIEPVETEAEPAEADAVPAPISAVPQFAAAEPVPLTEPEDALTAPEPAQIPSEAPPAAFDTQFLAPETAVPVVEPEQSLPVEAAAPAEEPSEPVFFWGLTPNDRLDTAVHDVEAEHSAAAKKDSAPQQLFVEPAPAEPVPAEPVSAEAAPIYDLGATQAFSREELAAALGQATAAEAGLEAPAAAPAPQAAEWPLPQSQVTPQPQTEASVEPEHGTDWHEIHALFGSETDGAADTNEVPVQQPAASEPPVPFWAVDAPPALPIVPPAAAIGVDAENFAALAAPTTVTPSGAGTPPRQPMRRSTKVLLWIVGILALAAVIVGLVALGFLISRPSGSGSSGTSNSQGASNTKATDRASVSPAADATSKSTPPPTGTLPAGSYAWNELRGGECLDPFTDAWAQSFTVVDCAAPHAAQLVLAAAYPAASFPGETAIAQQINALCTAPGVIDLGKASGFDDLQVVASYPVTQQQWDAGQKDYYCFVQRSSKQPITGTLVGTGPQA